jgi:5-methylcytosine-specific restriction endonuclease McrA
MDNTSIVVDERVLRKRAADKRYRERTKEYQYERKREWRERNKKHVEEKRKQWRIDNPEQHKANVARASRLRRARVMGVDTLPYSEEEVLSVYGTDCHICSKPIDLTAPKAVGGDNWAFGLHIDHLIPISKGGPDTLYNVRPSHWLCNVKKGHWGYDIHTIVKEEQP